MNKKNIVWIVVGVVVLVAVFYGGMVYGKSQTATAARTAYTGARTRGIGTTGGFGGLTSGQIISKDATSITVQLGNNGATSSTTAPSGSEIIFIDSNTKISKQSAGTMADLAVGTNVSVAGAPNADGSVNATTVQIRPNMPTTKPATTP